jgi:hypothetical protein
MVVSEGETYEKRAFEPNINVIIPLKPPYGYEPIVGTNVMRGGSAKSAKLRTKHRTQQLL